MERLTAALHAFAYLRADADHLAWRWVEDVNAERQLRGICSRRIADCSNSDKCKHSCGGYDQASSHGQPPWFGVAGDTPGDGGAYMRVDNSVPFTDWWPTAELRLRAALTNYRLRSQEVDDVVQTTAERALARPFNDREHMASWAIVVGQNLARDDWRRFGRVDSVADFSGGPSAPDLFDEVDARIKRDVMLASIADLTPEQRRTLAGDVDTTGNRQASVSEAVRRFRLRKDLRDVWDRLGVAVAGWRARLALRRFGGAAESVAAAAIVVSSVAAAIGVTNVTAEPDASTAPRAAAVQSATVAPLATAPTLASRSSTLASPLVSSPANPAPIVAVDLGHTPNGDRVGFDIAPQADAERGVLYCYGLPTETDDAKCIYYPKATVEAFHALYRLLGIDTP